MAAFHSFSGEEITGPAERDRWAPQSSLFNGREWATVQKRVLHCPGANANVRKYGDLFLRTVIRPGVQRASSFPADLLLKRLW